MAPIQYTSSMENNNSSASVDSARCESSVSKKNSSSSVQSSQCHQTFTNTSEQMSKSEKSTHVSDIKSGSEMKLPSLNNKYVQSSIKDVNEANSNQNSPMAIQTRGNFFEDSFFADVRENFQRSVSEVLEKWGESSSLCDNMTSYRKLRQLDLNEENQAGTISYGEKEHKIVLDVHDFKQEDIKVKVVENNKIQIIGHTEKKNGSSVSTQSFHRKFTLPGSVDMTRVTSSMSSDGILTIIIPKLENKQILNIQQSTGFDNDLGRIKEINQSNSISNKTTENVMKTTTGDSKASAISHAANIKSTVKAKSSNVNNSTGEWSKDKCTFEKSIKQPVQMTITKRGNFFEDNFFADVHDNFQKAVSEVLEKCGEKSSLCDDMISYRNLRQRDLKEENQAATVSYGEKEHKIVLDVNEFQEGDIKVKMSEDNTVQITGHIEKKNENAISTQSFHRQFTLPVTLDMTLVTSSMSSDGILTVVIPRIATKQLISNTKKDEIVKESNLNNEANLCSHENPITTGKSKKTMKTEDIKSSKISQTSNTESGIGENLSFSNSNTADISSEDKESNIDRETNEYSNENATITGKSMKSMKVHASKASLISQESITKSGTETNLSLNSYTADVSSKDKDTKGTSTCQPKSMTIRKRGNFFEDSFFADVHTNFQKAISEVLEKWGETSSVGDDMTSYRNLRQHNLKEENQAATVSYGEKEHKIVLDVNEFKEGDIKVKIIEDNTVQITGHIEKKNENAISTQSFHRQFTLPGTLDMTLVTSSMSSDGILTVIIPRLANKQMILNTKKHSKAINESKLNNETNQWSNENTTTGKSLKTMKEESKSSVVSHAKQATKQHIQQSSSYNSSRNSSSSLESIQIPSHVNSINNNTEASDIYSPINLSIRRRGQFFQDSFFNDCQNQFDEAMKSILVKFGNTNQVIDTEQRYRNLRQKELTEEQQACSMIQDSQKHKIVIDVKEFMEGNINVKVIGETKILVEGENKQHKGISSSQRFNRSFEFPNKIDASSVQSSLSSDGILSITVPKNIETAGNTKY